MATAMIEKLISDAARDLIVASEVTSEAVYKRQFVHTVWPGGGSGVTIGIGYDIGAGVSSKKKLWADWQGRISDAMINALEPAIGVTGSRAKALAQRMKSKVTIPWDTAIEVFDAVTVPRWAAIVRKALPNTDKLTLDQFGALVSLAYNRGPSFAKAGTRYTEMRAIKSHMAAQRFDLIPAEFRSMKRIWPTMRGLRIRRDAEAALFARGLTA